MDPVTFKMESGNETTEFVILELDKWEEVIRRVSKLEKSMSYLYTRGDSYIIPPRM